MFSGNRVKRHQGRDAVSSDADFQNIRNNLRPGKSDQWLNAHVNYDRWYWYHAVVEGIRHYDFRPADSHLKNRAWYFEPDYSGSPYGRLWTLPHDSDASWGPNWNSGVDYSKNAIFSDSSKGNFRLEYRNTIREFRDLVWTEDVINTWIDELAGFIDEFHMADRDRWRSAPSAAGYQDFGPMDRKVDDMKRFAFVGWSGSTGPTVGAGGRAAYLDNLARAEGDATSIPDTPTIASASPAEFPVDALAFTCGPFADPQGAGSFRAMQWRVGEITDPDAPAYVEGVPPVWEFMPVWESGELSTFANSIHVPGGALDVGHTYRARVRMKDNTGRWSHWSDPVEFTTAPPTATDLDALTISEIMYHPHDLTPQELAASPHAIADDFEFIELRNNSDAPIDLVGFALTDGVEFEFTYDASPTLAPGERAVLVRDPAAFALRYGDEVSIAGVYRGGLTNGGEDITLLDPFGRAVHEFTYDDGGGWSGRADGKGASLVAIDPAGDLGDPDNWRASVQFGGTPGADPAPDPGVVISEVLTRTDPPAVDAIELHNPTDAPIDVGGWYLSDDWGFADNPRNDEYQKFRIPDGSVIPAGGFVTFYEGHYEGDLLVADPLTEFGGSDVRDFALNGVQGDDVWLTTADAAGNLTGFADHVEFPAAIEGESFGRVGNTGNLAPMTDTTLGDSNAVPRVGPAVISEVMYQQGNDEVEGWTALEDSLEFIELHNASDAVVPLFDPADPTQTWRFANVGFSFPEGVEMLPGETLLVVPGEPDDFELKYEVAPGIRVFGPYTGVLDNSGERLRLMRPVPPSPLVPHVVPYVIADQLDYEPDGAWPATAPQDDPPVAAKSLQRTAPDAWGDDPTTWTGGEPTPGDVPWAAAIPRVVGRHLFYNNSAFDGNDPAASAADDAAIATDKQALRVGDVATFANYTSYGPGINGVMIDVAGATGAITLDAFSFRVGQGNPAAWDAPPWPTSFSVRAGEGVGGSDRVTLIWGDHTIRNQWLEVFVIGAPLGLAADDVFYFGSAVAESGNSPSDAQVTTTDLLLARNNPRNFLSPAPVDFPFDYNRDARVNTTDVLLARNNQTNFLTRLPLLDLTGGAGAAELAWLSQLDEEIAASRPKDATLPAAEVVDALLAED